MPVGKVSWFNDAQTASGLGSHVPGIAILNHSTLKGWWRVKFPNGRTLDLQQTDIGPATWTGKKVDVNLPALRQAGYTPNNFPTGAHVSYQYLGKQRPTGGTMAPTRPAASAGRAAPANNFWLNVHQQAAKGIPTHVPQGYNYGDVSQQVQQSLWTPEYQAKFAQQGGVQGFRQRELQRALKLRGAKPAPIKPPPNPNMADRTILYGARHGDVIRFQRAHGLAPTGLIDALTRRRARAVNTVIR